MFLLLLVTIFVSVHSESGAPIPGASVRIERGGSVVAEAVTDAEGRAGIPAVAAGEYVISVTKDGLERSSQVLVIQDSSRTIEIDFTPMMFLNSACVSSSL